MRSRDLSFTTALCVSLVVHAGLSLAITESYVREFGKHIWLPALSRPSVQETVTPQLAMLQPDEDPRRRLGDSDASGYAIDSSPGDEQLLARQGSQDQAFLSRDPVGPGKVGDPPTESLIPPGEGGAPAVELPAASPFAGEPAEAAPVGIPLPRESAPKPLEEPVLADDSQEGFSLKNPPSDVDAPKLEADVPALADKPPGGRPGPAIAADPAPQGESETDPVSMIGSVEFRRGSTVARLGRKHKLTRPRLTLGTKVDLMTMGTTVLVLKLRTDPAGNIVSAEVVHPSGSPDVDQLFRVTAYDWWFEPPKNDSDQPIADTFLFTIRIN